MDPSHDGVWKARIEKKLNRAEAYALGAIAQTVTPNPSWSQTAWFIDPQNFSGNASDNNNGATALAPKRTWRGVLQELATIAPVLTASPTFTFISSHIDDTDPVIFKPYLAGTGVNVTITATLPAPLVTGALGVVTALARATNVLLSAATMPAGAAVGQLIVNTTRGNSRAWVEVNLGAGAFQLSQPFVPAVVPLAAPPAEVTTWATADVVQLFNLRAVNVVDIEPTLIESSATFNNPVVITNLAILDPAGIGLDKLTLGNDVSVVECDVQRVAVVGGGTSVTTLGSCMHNCGFRGGILGGPTAPPFTAPIFSINGGYVLTVLAVTNCRLDGDVIVGTANASATLTTGVIGLVAIDTATTLNLGGSVSGRAASSFYAANTWYGAGILNVFGQGRLSYPSAAGAAVAAFKLTPRIQLNGGVMASSSTQAAPNVINNVVPTAIAAITAASLDAAASATGFGGNVANQGAAFNAGGASIANGAL